MSARARLGFLAAAAIVAISPARAHPHFGDLLKAPAVEQALNGSSAGRKLVAQLLGGRGAAGPGGMEAALVRLESRLSQRGDSVFSRLERIERRYRDVYPDGLVSRLSFSQRRLLGRLSGELLAFERGAEGLRFTRPASELGLPAPRVQFLNASNSRYRGLDEALARHLYEEQVLHVKNLGFFRFPTRVSESFRPENRPVFRLGYYLLPESAVEFVSTAAMSQAVRSEVAVSGAGGERLFRLFVHPESSGHYGSLAGKYPFVPPVKSPFLATPTMSTRSLLVWRPDRAEGVPFVAKLSLDREILSIDRLISEAEVRRSLSNQNAIDAIGAERLRNEGLRFFPETGGLILRTAALEGAPAKIGGMLLRELPAEMRSGERRWISWASLLSENGFGGEPLLLEVVRASGLGPEEFISRYMISAYLRMFERVSLRRGLSFEPHGQNLLFETKAGLEPTGRFVIRDFGGIWPDAFRMLRTGGPLQAYAGYGNAGLFRFLGGRRNHVASFAFFYKHQVFRPALSQLVRHHPEFSAAEGGVLTEELDRVYLELMRRYFGVDWRSAPSAKNYLRFRDDLTRGIPFDGIEGFQALSAPSEAAAAQVLVREMRAGGQWVVFEDTALGELRYHVSRDGLIGVSPDGTVAGYGIFGAEGRASIREFGGDASAYVREIGRRMTY